MTTTAEAPPRGALASPQVRTQGIAVRRSLVLMAFSALVPGSAQLVAGNKTVGRIAVRVWLTAVALIVVALLLVLPFRSFMIGLYTNTITLRILQGAVLLLGIGWSLLLLDAWRLGNPKVMSLAGKVVSGVLALALAVTGTGVAWAASNLFGVQASLFGDVFTGGGNTQVQNGRINVLLLGGDAGADRTGLRPDSMTVASIDANTGRTVLFSLPRNLQHAPFPADSPLHKLYPDGYYCHVENLSDACLLNGVYTLAMGHKNLFPGVKYPGVEATKGVIEEILGLKINYWAMIDLKGFQELINAVGGITLEVGKKVPIGSLDGKKGVYGWILPGKQHMDGFHALWFARSREYSTDYERMIRQKCVMNAMLKQLDPTTVVTKFQAIADAGKQIVATNLPSDQIGTVLDLAMKAKSLPMASVSFTPPLIVPMNPDFAKIRTTVTTAIETSEAKDDPAASSSSAPSSSASPGTTKKKTPNTTDDVSSYKICRVS